jgi:hypothetical protein
MQVDQRAAVVQRRPDRGEALIVKRQATRRAPERHSGETEVVQATGDLGDGLLHMRQRLTAERGQARGRLVNQDLIGVVDVSREGRGRLRVGDVGVHRPDAHDLQVDRGGVHVVQSARQRVGVRAGLGRSLTGAPQVAEEAQDAQLLKRPHFLQQLEVAGRVVMTVDVDPHVNPRRRRPPAGERRAGHS